MDPGGLWWSPASMELNSFVPSFSGNVPHLLSEAVFFWSRGKWNLYDTNWKTQPAEMLPEFQKYFLQSGAGSLAWGRARCGWPLTLCRLGHLTCQVTAASWLRLGAWMTRYWKFLPLWAKQDANTWEWPLPSSLWTLSQGLPRMAFEVENLFFKCSPHWAQGAPSSSGPSSSWTPFSSTLPSPLMMNVLSMTFSPFPWQEHSGKRNLMHQRMCPEFIATEGRLEASRSWELWGRKGSYSSAVTVFVWDDGKVLEIVVTVAQLCEGN